MGERRQLSPSETEQFREQVEEVKAQIGKESPPRVSYPVDKALISIWAIAIRWPEPPGRLYWVWEYANKSRYGGIIAPRYFNPFAYHIDEA